MQLGRGVPRDEERQPRIAFGRLEPGAPPAEPGTVRARPGAGLIARPSRRAIASTSSDARQIAYQRSPSAVRSIMVRPKTVPAACSPIHDADQLDVVLAERHDAVRGAPARVPAPGDRGQSVVAEQPVACVVEVAHGHHDVIDHERDLERPLRFACLRRRPLYGAVRHSKGAPRHVRRHRRTAPYGDRRRRQANLEGAFEISLVIDHVVMAVATWTTPATGCSATTDSPRSPGGGTRVGDREPHRAARR